MVYSYWVSKDRAKKEDRQDTALNYQGEGGHTDDPVKFTKGLTPVVARGEHMMGSVVCLEACAGHKIFLPEPSFKALRG